VSTDVSTAGSGDVRDELVRLSAADLSDRLGKREVSAVEATQAHLDRIAATDETVAAFLHVDSEGALAAARAVDEQRSNGEPLGRLAGVPLGLKDIFTTRGVPTTCGSRILEGWRPPYDATVTRRLRDAGLVILGKTNMDEFAMGSSTESSAYRKTRNPWRLSCVPGGSSGGSAAAVAAFQAPLTVGTDTGGSIRQPAAVCGLVGVKPTYGQVSRYGMIAFSSSLDQAGPVGRTVLDAALLHATLAGYDPCDSTSLDQPVPPVVEAAERREISGMRIGVIRELSGDHLGGLANGVLDRFSEAVAVLEELGAEVVEVSCPSFDYALPAYYLIAPSEASSNLARFDAMRYGLRLGDDGRSSAEEVMSLTRDAGFGPEVKRRIMIGTYALSSGYYDAYYGQAQKVRTKISEDFAAAFTRFDFVVTPSSPSVAFRLGEKTDDPLSMYLNDYCTVPMPLAGIPAISIPNGLSDGLPTGFQIAGPAFSENRILDAAHALERAIGFDGSAAREPA
jgi:aspartyl-tRNA(Asn)/glutamyl-tRNA(Gln) amidotransferase subunit A